VEATAGYRDEMDTLGSFISECCMVRDGEQVYAGKLYEKYGEWCQKSNEKQMTKTAFGLALKERGYQKSKDKTGNRLVQYSGLGIIDDCK